MFGRETTDTLVSRVAKIIPKEVCSQLSKPEIERQDHCNPPTDRGLYNSITTRQRSPHFTDGEVRGSKLRNSPWVSNPSLSDPKA